MPWRRPAWGEPETLLDVVHATTRAPGTSRPHAPHVALPRGTTTMPPGKDTNGGLVGGTPSPASERGPVACSDASGQLLEAMVKSCLPSTSPRPPGPFSPAPHSNPSHSLPSFSDPPHNTTPSQSFSCGAPSASGGTGRPGRACEAALRRQSSGLAVPCTNQADPGPGKGLGTGAGLSTGSLSAGGGESRGTASVEEEHRFSMLQQLVRAAGSAQASVGCAPAVRPGGSSEPTLGVAGNPCPSPSSARPSPSGARSAQQLNAFNECATALLSGSTPGAASIASWPGLTPHYAPLLPGQATDAALSAPEDAARERLLGSGLRTGSLGTRSLGTGSLGTGNLIQLQRELLRQGSEVAQDPAVWEGRGGATGAPGRASASPGQQRESPHARPLARAAVPSLAPQALGLQERLHHSAAAMSSYFDGTFLAGSDGHRMSPRVQRLEEPLPSPGAPGAPGSLPGQRLSGGATGSGPSLASPMSASEEVMLRALLSGAPGSRQGFLPQGSLQQPSPLGPAGLLQDASAPAAVAGKRQVLASASAGSCRYTSDTSTEMTGYSGGRLSLDETRARMGRDAAALRARLLGGTPAGSGSGGLSQSQGAPGSEGSPCGTVEGAQLDEKKRRRLAANREAARRMRRRHSERVLELEAQVAELRRLHRETTERLRKANDEVARLETANGRLERGVESLASPGPSARPHLDPSARPHLDGATHTPGDSQTAGGPEADRAQAQAEDGAQGGQAHPAAGAGAGGVATAVAGADAAGACKAVIGRSACKEEPEASAGGGPRDEPCTGWASSGRTPPVLVPEGGAKEAAALLAPPQGRSLCSTEGVPEPCPTPGGAPHPSEAQLQALGAFCGGLGFGESDGGDAVDAEGLLNAFGGADECMQDFTQLQQLYEFSHIQELSQTGLMDDMH